MKKERKEEEKLDPTDPSDQTDQTDQTDPTISEKHSIYRIHGGYRNLRSFNVATLIYDATVSFCNRFIERNSRTRDQMIQAARSGRQNIAEGNRSAATSAKTEIKLLNVARASLDELLLDYEDFLRQNKLPAWTKDSEEAKAVREMWRKTDPPDPSDPSDPTDPSDQTDQTDRTDPTDPIKHYHLYSHWLDSENPAIVANTIICLIHQANFLLDKQLAALEKQFIEEGGFSERLYRFRRENLSDPTDPSDRTDRTDRTDPTAQPKPPKKLCPLCGKEMILRTARKGQNSGSKFWGCSGYPECKKTIDYGP